MDQQGRLEKIFSTIHLIYHRNKNQHGKTAWWRWLSILRRSLLKLLSAPRNDEKRRMHISKYLHLHVIPKAFLAFSTVVADTQFSALGTVLMATLAQTRRAILPLPQSPRREKAEPNEARPRPIIMLAKKNGTDHDFGTPINRVIKEVVELPKIDVPKCAERSVSVENPDVSSTEPKKIKKNKAKKKKAANAIDDIFSSLR